MLLRPSKHFCYLKEKRSNFLYILIPQGTKSMHRLAIGKMKCVRTKLYAGEYIATGLALSKNIRSPAIHRASPVYSQMGYIWTKIYCTKIYFHQLYTELAGISLYINILSPAIHRILCIAGESIFLYRDSPLYSQMRYIGTGLVYGRQSLFRQPLFQQPLFRQSLFRQPLFRQQGSGLMPD